MQLKLLGLFPQNLSLWPDALLLFKDGRRIALEITQLIHESDENYTKEIILREKEEYLERYIQENIKNSIPYLGGLINIDIDLEKLNIDTRRKTRIIGDEVLLIIIPILNEIKLSSENITEQDFYFNSPNFKMTIISKIGLHDLCSDVGYKGQWLSNVDSNYIQIIINKKELKNMDGYDEAWLLIKESDSSLRNSIDIESIYKSWYDKVFILRLSNTILELKINR